MQWLTLAYFLSLGTMNYQLDMLPIQNAVFVTPKVTFQTTLGVELQAFDNHVFIGGSVQTWENTLNFTGFYPMESLYTFNAGLRYGAFEIGFRHECDHITEAHTDQSKNLGFGAVKNEFYLSIHGSINLF